MRFNAPCGRNGATENAGVENAGVDNRGGKFRSGKSRSRSQGWKSFSDNFQHKLAIQIKAFYSHKNYIYVQK